MGINLFMQGILSGAFLDGVIVATKDRGWKLKEGNLQMSQFPICK